MSETMYEKYERLFKKVQEILKRKYKCEVKMPEEVHNFDLILKRESAEEILLDVKDVEFRKYSDYYNKRLLCDDILDAYAKYKDDTEIIEACEDWDVKEVLEPMKVVRSIHFRDYNNTWYLDIEVRGCNLVLVDNDSAIMLYEETGDTTLFEWIDEMGDDYGKEKVFTYFFILGDVIDMKNLE